MLSAPYRVPNERFLLDPTRLVRQSARRYPCRYRCRIGADPRSHRIFRHRRGRSTCWPLCLLFHCRDHRLHGRPRRHDLCRDRLRRRGHHTARARSWRRLSVRRDNPHGRAAGDRGTAAPRPPDAICFALGRHGLCQRARDSDLPGADAAAPPCAAGHICAGGGRAGDHLSVPLSHQGDPLAVGRNRRPDGHHHLWRRPRQHRGRHGQAADISPDIRPAERAVQP